MLFRSEHQAKAIIFTGVAGGLNKNLNVGDILIGHTVFQHDFGFLGSSFKTYAVGVLPEIGIGNGKESIYFNLRGAHFDRALQILMGLQNTLEPVEVNQRLYHPRITTGAIATGDQFIANESRRSELLVLGADAVEMEGAAITQVAFKSSIPCFVIRAISDKAGEHANFDFRRFLSVVATNNAKLVTHLFLKETPAACL